MVQTEADADGEDRALLARIAGGDRPAFEMLYRRHAAWLTARLQSRCGDPDLADSAVQDTFLSIWRSAKSYRGEGDVGAWIWGIGIRRLIDLLRRRRSMPLDPSVIGALSDTDLRQRSIQPDDTPEESVGHGVDTEARDELARAMLALPDELRAVLIVTAIDGLTTKEAARLLGLPQGTVKTRLMRARHQLQEAMS